MAGPLAVAGAALLAIGSVMGISPARDILNRWLYFLFPTAIPNVPELVEQRYRNIIGEKAFLEFCRQNGFTVEHSQNAFKAAQTLLTASDLIASKRREIINEKTFIEKMEQLHFIQEDIDTLTEVTKFFPSPSDLITFAVREVFTETIRNKFGMDEDRPEVFMIEAEKAGLPADQAKNFWAAHWILPPVTQGFDMLHRGIIEEPELDLLLKSLDLMPFWREKIKELSFRPFTRVDVRRMYSLGVLDESGIKRAYLDLGFDDDKADKMTEFTIKFESTEFKGLTRASIVSAFKKGAITDIELAEFLVGIGLSEQVAGFWINFATYEKTATEIDDSIDTQVELYVNGIISKGDLNVQLNQLNLPATYTDLILRKADLKKRRSAKVPSKEDLIKWLSGDIIDNQEFTSRMENAGFSLEDIVLYIEQIIGGETKATTG